MVTSAPCLVECCSLGQVVLHSNLIALWVVIRMLISRALCMEGICHDRWAITV